MEPICRFTSQITGTLIAIQILTGFVGSIIASTIILCISNKSFKKTIDASAASIKESLTPFDEKMKNIANEIKELKNFTEVIKNLLGKIK
jgi:hypothetical protein